MTSSPPRTRILFVDDEPLFLHSLRSVMRKHRTMWDMSFASSAEEALELLAATPVDVVVSDMRMPHMDGAEFLRRVQELDPGAARLVLSGHADPEMLERAAPVAQQYLVKPCPSDRLHAVLERVCELQRTLDNQAVRERIGRVGRLPAISENYSQLSGAVARPRVDVAEIVAIVAREPAMSAKLLQLANSPYFQSGSPVTSVREAVGRLGLDLVVRLPMMLCAFGDSRVDSTGAEAFSPLELQQASIATARLAGKFAHNDHDRDLAFTAGLIHEIGRLLLVRESPEEMRAMVGEAAASGRPLTELERARLSTTHAEIGAYALGMWGLPIAVVEAVAYHHVIPAERRAELRIAALVHAADVLLEQALATPNGPPVEQLDLQTMDALGFTPLLPAWRQLATIEARSIRRA